MADSSNIELDIYEVMQEIGKNAKAACAELLVASSESKNIALIEAAKSLRNNKDRIISENVKDVDNAIAKNSKDSFIDRLKLDEKRIEAMAEGLESIAKLGDPVGDELARWQEPNGLDISRVRVPLGVIGVIYESRPNVTADAGALCLKSGNASILRGGSESFYSSSAIIESMHEGLRAAGLPVAAIQSVPTSSRDAVGEMLKLNDYIDVIIPRGGKGLIKRIIAESKIPTLQHLDGNCHTYVNKGADLNKALSIVENAKMRRTGICGATETLVVDRSISSEFLPKMIDVLSDSGCEIRGDEKVVGFDDRVIQATEEDWDTEFLDPIISIKVVEDIDEAILFISQHSSHHTDAIVTEDDKAAEEFFTRIDSAIVMQNSSTQFADGGEFGMGAEIGIATGKLHARGPVGVEQLTTFKYVVRSEGAVRPK